MEDDNKEMPESELIKELQAKHQEEKEALEKENKRLKAEIEDKNKTIMDILLNGQASKPAAQAAQKKSAEDELTEQALNNIKSRYTRKEVK